MSYDFAKNHIPGAVNVPPDTSVEQIRVLLGSLHDNGAIILYCQNTTCPYAAKLALLLDKAGYNNLTLFPGGWGCMGYATRSSQTE